MSKTQNATVLDHASWALFGWRRGPCNFKGSWRSHLGDKPEAQDFEVETAADPHGIHVRWMHLTGALLARGLVHLKLTFPFIQVLAPGPRETSGSDLHLPVQLAEGAERPEVLRLSIIFNRQHHRS
jgi:hypothetical protein